MITISIPVKPYVKKYLVKRYGLAHQITKRSFIGLLIIQFLDKDTSVPDDSFELKEKYDVVISERYFNINGFSLSPSRLRFLGKCLEQLFFEDFYDDIDKDLAKNQFNAYQSVKFFLDYYNINESEIKLESMYRNYQRYSKENIKEKKKSNSKLIA